MQQIAWNELVVAALTILYMVIWKTNRKTTLKTIVSIYEYREKVYYSLTWGDAGLTLRWDIALLRLSSEASLNNYVRLGALPPSGQVLPNNNPCYITGWGRTQSESDMMIYLLDKTRYSAQYLDISCYYGFYHSCMMGVYYPPQPEVTCLPSWSRPPCLLLTTKPAAAMDGGVAPWRPPWSVLVVAAIPVARWASEVLERTACDLTFTVYFVRFEREG